MASHVFHEIYLHLNWHTKNDQPFLDSRLEPIAHELLRQRCRQTKGVYFHGIGGTENHVHLAINIEPFVIISELVGELKGGSSFDANKSIGFKALEWQRGYGVVSFGKMNLPWVLKYFADQKQHHARGTVQERLERITMDVDPKSEPEGGNAKPG